MTLIEVLAALMIMGSLVVGLVLARGRLVGQHAHALDKQQAIEAADALLSQWWATDPPQVPTDMEGTIEGHLNWIWQTRSIEIEATHDAARQGVVLIILDKRNDKDPQVLTSVTLFASDLSEVDRSGNEIAALSSARDTP